MVESFDPTSQPEHLLDMRTNCDTVTGANAEDDSPAYFMPHQGADISHGTVALRRGFEI